MVRQIIILYILYLHISGFLAIWDGQELAIAPKNQVVIKKCYHVVAGGSVLTNRMILTAAYPVYYSIEQELTIVGGEINPHRRNVHHYEVEKIFVHPEYNAKNRIYEVAILKLKTQLNFRYWEPVRLIAKDVYPVSGHKQLLSVAGWGLSQYLYTEENLRNATLSVHHEMHCKRIFESESREYNNDLLFCGGGLEGGNVCFGDIGNPVMDERGTQVGIVALDAACNYMIPAYFTKISNSLVWDWISNTKTKN